MALLIWSIAVAVVFFVLAKNSVLDVIQWFFSKNVWQHLLVFFGHESWPADLFVGSLIFMLFCVAVYGFAEMAFYVIDRLLRNYGLERYGLILERDYLIIRLPGDAWVDDPCFCVHRDDFKESRIVRRGKDPKTKIQLTYYRDEMRLGGYVISRWFGHLYELSTLINAWKVQPDRYSSTGVGKVGSPPEILLRISRVSTSFYYLVYLFILASFFVFYAL